MDDLPLNCIDKLSSIKNPKLPDRYFRALKRNLYELRWAIWERKALLGLHKEKTYHGVDFFSIAGTALYNDMISHTIKVLDRNKESATFWYLYRCNSTIIDNFIKKKGYDLKQINQLSDKLIGVRVKTHFHIDREAVFDPRRVWSDANIRWKEFAKILDSIWNILQHLHDDGFGKKFITPKYNGNDATELIKVAQEKGIIPLYKEKGPYIGDVE